MKTSKHKVQLPSITTSDGVEFKVDITTLNKEMEDRAKKHQKNYQEFLAFKKNKIH